MTEPSPSHSSAGYGCGTRSVDETIVILEVGSDRKRIVAHRDILKASSEFFRAALKDEWNTEKKNIIAFPDDDEEAIELYITWLYSKKAPLATSEALLESQIERLYYRLTHAYILADKFADIEFADCVINVIMQLEYDTGSTDTHISPLPTKQSVGLAYESAPEGSPIRKLYVQMYADDASNGTRIDGQNYHFLVDLCNALIAHPKAERVRSLHWSKHRCTYHRHDDDVRCPAEKTWSTCKISAL